MPVSPYGHDELGRSGGLPVAIDVPVSPLPRVGSTSPRWGPRSTPGRGRRAGGASWRAGRNGLRWGYGRSVRCMAGAGRMKPLEPPVRRRRQRDRGHPSGPIPCWAPKCSTGASRPGGRREGSPSVPSSSAQVLRCVGDCAQGWLSVPRFTIVSVVGERGGGDHGVQKSSACTLRGVGLRTALDRLFGRAGRQTARDTRRRCVECGIPGGFQRSRTGSQRACLRPGPGACAHHRSCRPQARRGRCRGARALGAWICEAHPVPQPTGLLAGS